MKNHKTSIENDQSQLNPQVQQQLNPHLSQSSFNSDKEQAIVVYDIRNSLTEEAKKRVEQTIETHAYHKNSYFFTPSANARGRRKSEEDFHASNPDYILLTSEGQIRVVFDYRQTCKNVYYSLSIKIDSQKKDIRLLKKLLKEK